MRFYLDTMEWVYHFEDHPLFAPEANALIQRLRNEKQTVLSSLFVLGEILVVPKRKGNQFAVAQLRRFFFSRAVILCPHTPEAVERFSELRANSHVKPLDALHLAVAASAGTDFFITRDTKLHNLSVANIGHIVPPEAVSPSFTA